MGITELDADILLYCAENPLGLFSYQIVEKTDALRGMVDQRLDYLCEIGMLTKIMSGKRNKFYSVDADLVISSLTQQSVDLDHSADSFSSLLEQYRKNSSNKTEGLDISFYHGEEGYKEVQEDRINVLKNYDPKKREVLFLGHNKFRGTSLRKHYEAYVSERIKHKIRVRTVTQDNTDSPESKLWQTNPDHLRETRYIDASKLPSNTTMIVYPDTVVFNTSGEQLNTILIRNTDFAKMGAHMFNTLWDSLG